MKIKSLMLSVILVLVAVFTPGFADVKPVSTGPLETPEVEGLADAIIKLQPKTTPFVAKFMAMNILNESKAKKLDPDLVTALMWVESQFNPNALGPPIKGAQKGAVGLLQLRFEVWKDQPELKDNGVDIKHKLFWIDANIKCGTDILAKYLSEANGNIAVALNRYYSGDPKLTKNPWEYEYISKIMYFYYKIREHRLNGVPLEAEEIAAAPTVELIPAKSKPSAGTK